MYYSNDNKKKLLLIILVKIPIFLAILFIILSVVFVSGLFFERWVGADRVAPQMINFIRNKFLGDDNVLEIEKKYFKLRDKRKKDNKRIVIDSTTDEITYTPHRDVIKLAQNYILDYRTINSEDISILKKISDSFFGDILPIYTNPEPLEGHWEKYEISNTSFRPLYAKTFLRSDIERDFAKAYIYKFDLDKYRIEFVPGLKDSELRDGKMSKRQREKVKWIFSGGYQYQHGKYGMMHNGEILLPPKVGVQTLFFYKNGTYKMSEWKKDTTVDDSIISFRQNELPLITNGEITNKINKMWGLTPKDVDPIYTVRSGLGLTDDGYLIFAFGDNLSAETLAIAMVKAGVKEGMHLDMNYFNVHLVSVEQKGKRIITFNENEVLSYYKNIYSVLSNRDYFILTLKE